MLVATRDIPRRESTNPRRESIFSTAWQLQMDRYILKYHQLYTEIYRRGAQGRPPRAWGACQRATAATAMGPGGERGMIDWVGI